ncbi:MAG TPA: hypothetical protein VGZ52_09680 [Acidimicrobiales bacterium]|jgi:hypothetical protein|nr:hypothetical protein [Acidimicrobiales bacterium]
MVRAPILLAAFALAVTSRGDVVVLAVLLGFGAGVADSGVAVAFALSSALVRWGSSSLAAIAGAQAVLGPAGWTGSAPAVASAWFAAVALVLAAAPRSTPRRVVALAAVAPFGAAAADVTMGSSAGAGLWLRVLASVVATVVITLLPQWRTRSRIAVAAGLVALVCAGFAR